MSKSLFSELIKTAIGLFLVITFRYQIIWIFTIIPLILILYYSPILAFLSLFFIILPMWDTFMNNDEDPGWGAIKILFQSVFLWFGYLMFAVMLT